MSATITLKPGLIYTFYRARENTRDFSRGMVAGGSYLLV